MTQALITKNAKSTADNIIVGIKDTVLRKRLFVYTQVIESLNDYFINLGFNSSTKSSLFKNNVVSSKFDIADFYIEELRADIRICDDASPGVLIPKQHRELAIEPDLYIAVKIAQDLKSYEILGFIPTEQMIFDKEIQDYYIFNPQKLLTIDRFKKLQKSIKIKKYKTHLKEREIFRLFVKMQEEDLSLDSQKAIMHCLLANKNTLRKLNSTTKLDTLSKNIPSYRHLLEEIKPNFENDPSQEIEEVEAIDQKPNISQIIDDTENIEEILSELQPESEQAEQPSAKKRKKPLFLHIIAIILIGFALIFFGLNKKPENTELLSDQDINNAVIPNQAIFIEKISWGISPELASNADIKNYLNLSGQKIKQNLFEELLSVKESPTKNEFKLIVVLDGSGQFKTSIIKQSTGSKKLDKIISNEVENTLKNNPSKNIRTSAPFIRIVLIINL